MAIIAKASFILLNNIIGQRLATILAVLIGVVLYFILLIITGSITTEDFKLLPKGDKIEKKLERFKIFK
jgi:stage V sporulation protein B